MNNSKKSGFIIIIIFILLLPLISANIIDFFKGTLEDITGRGTSNATTVTIIVGANAPNVSFVSLNASRTIVEGGTRYLVVSFYADDTDGNLENGSAKVNVSRGSTVVTNTSCSNAYVNNIMNYTCTIAIDYWYDAGDWYVVAEINDSGNLKGQNTSSWSLQELTGMNVTLAALTWPSVVPSDINKTSNNDPISLHNTGNKDTLDIFVQGIDLYEDAAGATYIPASNFTVFNATSAGNKECEIKNKTSAVTYGGLPILLGNNTDVAIVLNSLPRSSTNIESLYFCLYWVPNSLTSATYSTAGTPNEEDWTISVS